MRTITLGLSLLDCATGDIKRTADKVYEKICREAHDLVPVGEAIEREFGIPIVNKRVSVTPISLVAAGSGAQSYVPYAQALDRAAHEIGVNFLTYLTNIRMEQARKLLVSTSLPIAEVSEQCGYGDYRVFTKAFKKAEGVTPSQYRRDFLENGT